jgi:hypothetical protein
MTFGTVAVFCLHEFHIPFIATSTYKNLCSACIHYDLDKTTPEEF